MSGNPLPQLHPGTLVIRDRDRRPPRGPPGAALLLYVAVYSALLGDLV